MLDLTIVSRPWTVAGGLPRPFLPILERVPVEGAPQSHRQVLLTCVPGTDEKYHSVARHVYPLFFYSAQQQRDQSRIKSADKPLVASDVDLRTSPSWSVGTMTRFCSKFRKYLTSAEYTLRCHALRCWRSDIGRTRALLARPSQPGQWLIQSCRMTFRGQVTH